MGMNAASLLALWLAAQAAEEAATALLAAGPHPLAQSVCAQPLSLGSSRLAAQAAAGDADAAQALAAAGSARLVGSCDETLPRVGVRACLSRALQQAAAPLGPATRLPPPAGGGGGSVSGQDTLARQHSVASVTAVADSVKGKIQRLQQQVAAGEARVAQLLAEAQQAQRAREQALQAALEQHQVGGMG